MGLSSGCTKHIDNLFAAKYNLTIVSDLGNGSVSIKKINNNPIHLFRMQDDCTAATISTYGLSDEFVLNQIPIIQEYLSLNAHINCFGTRLIQDVESTKNFIKGLVKNNCRVISVTPGNRNNLLNEFMVSYNICVPNPIIKGYRTATLDDFNNTQHVSMDMNKDKELRKQFGLYIKQGKSL